MSLPMAYCYGLSVLNSHLKTGGSVALIDEAPTGGAFWRWFDAAAGTTFAGVPETYRLLAAAGERLVGHRTLRLATLSGGRFPEERVREWASGFTAAGMEFAMMYGQTEATSRISSHRGTEVLAACRSVGYPLQGVRLWIESEDGLPVAEGGHGEIALGGNTIMLGYVHSRTDLQRLPPSSPPTRHTGDLGYLVDGRLYVTGRLHRVAKPMGVRVQLDEVEVAFQTLGPAAAMSDAEDRVIVYVEGSLADYRPVYRQLLAAYRLPPGAVRLVRVDALPRTVAGKVAYGELNGGGE
jgi:acyl-coenzyme A synthetase/AMP-(fatty) acid ligase